MAEEKKEEKAVKRTQVREIPRPGNLRAADTQTVLVEYKDEDGPHRVVVPRKEYKDGEVETSKLKMGVPYGEDWEDIVAKALPSKADIERTLARRLRENGIWTKQDLHRNAQAAVGAIQHAYHVDLAALVAATADKEKENK